MARTKKPPPPTAEEILVDLPRDAYLRKKLIALEKFLGGDSANGQALVNGTRLAAQLKAELTELLNPVAAYTDPTAGLTDAEVVVALADALRALPLAALDDVLEMIDAERVPRHTPDLRVVKGTPS